MFDKFGEFDSAEEINRAAAAQLEEGDVEAVFAIAEENGIDKEDAEDYIDGCAAELATHLMASLGKIEVEARDLKLEGVFVDWKEIIAQYCTEDERFSCAVRRKGKRLEQCMGELLKQSFAGKKQVNERICRAAGLRDGGRKDPVYMGIPNRAEDYIKCHDGSEVVTPEITRYEALNLAVTIKEMAEVLRDIDNRDWEVWLKEPRK